MIEYRIAQMHNAVAGWQRRFFMDVAKLTLVLIAWMLVVLML